MCRVPFTLSLLLSLILVVTAQGMAFSRGQAPAQGQMILCTAQGAVRIFTDADGRPTSPPQLCAEGVQALFAVGVDAPVAAQPPFGFSGKAPQLFQARGAHSPPPRLSARDPPRS